MTEPKQPSSGSIPDPVPNHAAGPVPPPPPAPFEAPAPAPAPTSPPHAYQQPPYPGQQPPPYQAGPQYPPPYGQVPTQPPSAGSQPPRPPYPPYPPYAPYPQQPHRQTVWPWVLVGCLVVFVLVMGGIVSCSALTAAVKAGEHLSAQQYHGGGYGGGYGDGYGYGYGGSGSGKGQSRDYDNGSGSDNSLPPSSALTLDNIQKAFDTKPGTVANGRCQAGLYEVGAAKDVKPGLYFFEGSQKNAGDFYVFQKTGPGLYAVQFGVNYFGNYFADLKEGDVIVFKPEGGESFYPSSLADFKPQPPYQSGLYRVGTDLPAGTYTINASDQALVKAGSDCAAIVMKDLSFGDDSTTDTKYVKLGGSQTVTVKDGDYLELYAATATISDHTK